MRAIYTEKKGLFNNKKYDIYIKFYSDKIVGSALKVSDAVGYDKQRFEIYYDNITNYEEYVFENYNCLKIDTCTHYVTNSNIYYDTYILPLNPPNNMILKNI